jgi:hypothetical protein
LRVEAAEIEIANAQEIAELLDERGIKLEDIREAIAAAETRGSKLYRADLKDRFLTRAVAGNFNVYVEYSPAGSEFLVHSVYAHRIMLVPFHEKTGEKEPGEPRNTEWNCYLCKVGVQEVDDVGLVYREFELPDAVGYRCPRCGLQLLSETTVMTQMFMAELMLEAK